MQISRSRDERRGKMVVEVPTILFGQGEPTANNEAEVKIPKICGNFLIF